jgi:hypothetical protein
MKRVLYTAAFIIVSALGSGCASTGGYFADRGRDAADVLTVAGGLGAGVKARVGPFALGLVYHREAIGLRGGALYNNLSFDDNIGDVHLAVLGHETFSPYRYPKNIWEQRKKRYYTPYLILPMPIACPSSQKIETLAYLTQIEAVIGLGPSIRLGFNPGELLDFILGWSTIDIFNDDLKDVAPRKAPEVRRQQSEEGRRLQSLTLEQRRQLRDAHLKEQEDSNQQIQKTDTNASDSDL